MKEDKNKKKNGDFTRDNTAIEKITGEYSKQLLYKKYLNLNEINE